ncbi:MAG TPA: acyl carrier protein [Candidatus Binatia bacterium]
MNPERVREEVEKILRDELRWQGTVPDGGLDVHFDSLQRMSLVVAIEDHFHICFEPEDEESIRDFDDLLRSIVEKTGEQA